nr:hypothetical protein [Candidatus Omnitrophota bacterium]
MNYTRIRLPLSTKTAVLALGGQSKSAFCFIKGNTAYLSDFRGDLSDLNNFKKFERDIKRLQKKLKISPRIIACDLHPEYVSTKYALRTTNYCQKKSRAKPRDERRTTKIQHHEAHIASCMTDNNINGKVIGIAFDGTGFGSDGNIWGGEFFVGGIKRLKRIAHLKYIPMPGGEASIKEPWRMAFSYLYDIYGKSSISEILTRLDKKKIDMLSQMIDKNINSPLTSSMGRLFDAVSSLIGICDSAGYEGEAAIELEKAIPEHRAWGIERKKYKFGYFNEAGVVIIDWEPVIRSVVKDLKSGVKKPEISLKFHNSACDMIKEICNLLRRKYKIKKVCISGGVFQNKYLSERIKPILEKEGFNVYAHKSIPAHDGGIALGQAVLAGA